MEEPSTTSAMTRSLFKRVFLYMITPCFFLVHQSYKTATSTSSGGGDGAAGNTLILNNGLPFSSPSIFNDGRMGGDFHLAETQDTTVHADATTIDAIMKTKQTIPKSLETFVAKRVAPASTSTTTEINKPYLIIHVGPPKTGTTTLQEELYAHKDMLQSQDNIVYAGAFYESTSDGGHLHAGRLPIMETFLNTTCHQQLAKVRRDHYEQKHDSLAREESVSIVDQLRQVPCWNSVLQELRTYRNTSALIFSNEVLSTNWGVRVTNDKNETYRAPLDWLAMQETLSQDWNIQIVVGYRRYMDWIVSSKRQQERYKSSKLHLRSWPPPLGTGRASIPLLPKLALQIVPSYSIGGGGDDAKKVLAHPAVPFYYTDTILQQYQPFALSSSLELRVFNLHEAAARNQSLLTLFLCDILPFPSNSAAPDAASSLNSCRYSRQRDAQKHQEASKTAAIGGGVHRTANQHDDTMLRMTYYDTIAIAAVAAGMVNATKIQRRQAALACRDFDESLHQPLQQTLSSQSFPLSCPTHAQYKAFLDFSLQKEREILASTSSLSLEKMQEEHRQAFYKAAVHDKKFCWIDTKRILRNETWRTFLTSLTP